MDQKRHIQPRAGALLISEPHLDDFFFGRSVVLLADHGEDGSFGIILNKTVKARFNDIVKDFPAFDVPLYLGGPVKTDTLFFIHTVGEDIRDSALIMEGLYWGGKLEDVQEHILSGRLTPDQIRFFIGYAGWSPNQLDTELEQHSWIVKDVSVNDVIHLNTETMWQHYIRSMGKDYAIWSNYPANPILN